MNPFNSGNVFHGCYPSPMHRLSQATVERTMDGRRTAPITEVGGERVLLDRRQILRILSRIAANWMNWLADPFRVRRGPLWTDSRQWLRQCMADIKAPDLARQQQVVVCKAC
jgi:hypothetical protein